MGPITGLRYAGAQANGVTVQIMAIDPPAYQRLSGLTFDSSEGDPYAALAAGRATIATPIFASAHHVRVGDNVTSRRPRGRAAYRLVGIGADYLTAKINTLYISQQNLATDFHKTEDVLFLANLAPNADRAAVRSSVEALLRDYPQFALYWSADWRASQRVIFDQVFIGLYAVLLVLIIPSLLGLINTLAINVLERTREIGVLRAIGATRRQVRQLVLAEALLLGAVGAVLGMVAGIALGYALTLLAASALTGQLQFAFPWGTGAGPGRGPGDRRARQPAARAASGAAPDRARPAIRIAAPARVASCPAGRLLPQRSGRPSARPPAVAGMGPRSGISILGGMARAAPRRPPNRRSAQGR